MLRLRFSPVWLAVGLWWALFLAAALWIYSTHPNGAGDFKPYYRTAYAVVSGTPLYVNLAAPPGASDQTAPGIPINWSYIYPPLLAQALAPLAAVADETTAAWVWFGVNAGLLIVTTAMISRWLVNNRQRLILWLAVPLFAPVLMSLWMGQITIVLFALAVGAWAAYRGGRPGIVGALLVLSAWLKLYPALVILYFLWKRDWQVIAAAVITTAVTGLLQIVISGADTFWYYLTSVLPDLAADGQPALNHSNNAILGFAQKLFSESPQIEPLLVSPLLVTLTRFGLLAGMAGLTFYLISRPAVALSRTPARKFDLEYAAVLLLSLLGGSTLGVHGMLSALLVYAILLRDCSGLSLQTRTRLKWLSILSAGLINLHVPIILGYLQPPSDNILPALALSLPFWGMMIIWGMTIFMLRRQAAAATSDRRRSSGLAAASR